jgi:hypothetical protein
MASPEIQHKEEPKAIEPLKYNYKPFDELGFFMDPKIDKEVWRKIKCHCNSCEVQALYKIYEGGVHNPKQLGETYKTYEKSVSEVRYATWGKKKEITIADFIGK